jgi:threonyl-tRNA synthetase
MANTKQLKKKKHNPMDDLPEHDHRKIGPALGLFSIQDDLGAGLPVFHPKGAMLWKIIENFLTDMLLQKGYQLAKTPHVYKAELWEKSGHANKYKENMFFTESDDQKFGVKPMNCPGHIYIYKSGSHSYRELPIRLAEIGTVYRNEMSGNLSGLTRVRGFAQDDAHIFCREDQIEEEIAKMINLTFEVYKIFGIKIDHIELSTRPEKFIGKKEIWEKAEKIMEDVLKKNKVKYKLNKGDGAFYGPKIDTHVKDALGRTWQLGTIQLDFFMPKRFELNYIEKDGKKTRVVMLHRTILGAMERFIALLIEQYKGEFPLWLSPVQIRIINMNDELIPYAEKIKSKLQQKFRVDADYRVESVGKKIHFAGKAKIPYTIVIGEKEKASGKLAVRDRKGKQEFGVDFDKFVARLEKEISEKK